MKCNICNREIKIKNAKTIHGKIYCKRCYSNIPDEIVIFPINDLYKIKDSKPLV